VICGNKIDMDSERYIKSSNRQVLYEEAERYAQKNKLLNFEVSAKTGQNMTKMIYYSIANLPFFGQFKVGCDELIRELGKNYFT
jgi:hypothetical protein